MTARPRAHANVAALLLILAVAGCTHGGGGTAGLHSWSVPGTVRIAIREPKTLNPLLASDVIGVFLTRLMFEPLLSADTHGNPVPILATAVPTMQNGGVSADGLTVTYHLRTNAKWSDGVAVSAEDVRWSWSAIMNPANNVVSRHGYDDVRSIDTPDSHTVVIHLKTRFAPFVNTFFAESDQPYDVAPAHVLSRYKDFNQVPFNGEPTVSDGPFRFAAWRRGDGIDMTANPDFFMGKPGLDKIKIVFTADDNTAANLLAAHNIDYFFQAPISLYPQLDALPDAHMVLVDMNAYEGLQFNLLHWPLQDAVVRRAIGAAIDKAALVQTLTHGQSRVATEDIPWWMWAYDPSVAAVPFDLAKSKELLASDGWTPGPDGILRKDGKPLSLSLVGDVGAAHRSEAVILQSALHRIGVDVSVKFFPESALYAPAGMGGILHSGKWDLILAPWFSGIDPDDSSQFLCSQVPPNGYNDTHYCEPEMEAAQQLALTQYGRPQRKAAYATIENLIARDNPELFFWYTRELEAISVDFKGFAPNPVVESWNAWQWSM